MVYPHPRQRRGFDEARAAGGHRTGAGARVHRSRPVARFPQQRHPRPDNPDYQALAASGFAGWRLEVGGLVERPARLSLDELRALPSRTQITRHDCVEGWSCIGKWKGARLSALLDRVGVRPEARYVMFFCADPMDLIGRTNITRASTSAAPITRRPSSPTR